MKNLLTLFLLAAAISALLMAPSLGGVRSAQRITLSDILRAHGVSPGSDLTPFDAVATKLQFVEGNPDGTEHNFLSQTVWLSSRAGSLRYGNVRLLDDTTVTESYEFNGAMYHRSVVGLTEPVDTTTEIGDTDSKLTLSRIAQFGIQPFLSQLADPRTEATYLRRTASGNEVFKVQPTSDSWTLYANETGLIQKIELGAASIVFSAYRTVKGVRLPFNERVYGSHGLFYELEFIRIDPKPAIDKDSFNQPDPFKQVGR